MKQSRHTTIQGSSPVTASKTRFQRLPETGMVICRVSSNLSVEDLDSPDWRYAPRTTIEGSWSGKHAGDGRSFDVCMLWSASALYVRFYAAQVEPLVKAEKPDLTKKTLGLWERDVCEIFIAPDTSQRHRYFEFEVAPTGEWVDLAIDNTLPERVTDVGYDSEMTVSARIEPGRIIMAMKIPWKAFGKTPKVGDIWLGNIFRCVGKEPDRGYLAWQPTKTDRPDFHVPSAFGEFEFVK